jgi:hypothetical protein
MALSEEISCGPTHNTVTIAESKEMNKSVVAQHENTCES